jgi:proline dehydrogenase
MHELLQRGASALRKAALRTNVKEFILGNEVLFHTLRRADNQYIGGNTLEETFPKFIRHNQQGFACSGATHDPRIPGAVEDLVTRYRPGPVRV